MRSRAVVTSALGITYGSQTFRSGRVTPGTRGEEGGGSVTVTTSVVTVVTAVSNRDMVLRAMGVMELAVGKRDEVVLLRWRPRSIGRFIGR